MKTALIAGSFLCFALALSGCATILSGSTQTLTVNSNVPGAEVTLNGVPLGATPLIATLKRGEEGLLSVQMPGHVPFQAPLTKKINSVFWVNIFAGGISSTTDYSTGAMYAYEPDTYFVTLAPAAMTPPAAELLKRTETLRAFVLLNNEVLASELAAGHGEYVDALSKLLQVSAEQRVPAVKRWRSSYASSDTALAFADRIVAELPKQ